MLLLWSHSNTDRERRQNIINTETQISRVVILIIPNLWWLISLAPKVPRLQSKTSSSALLLTFTTHTQHEKGEAGTTKREFTGAIFFFHKWKTPYENNHPEPNPLQGHSYIPQGTPKKVSREFTKKSGRPLIQLFSLDTRQKGLHKQLPP